MPTTSAPSAANEPNIRNQAGSSTKMVSPGRHEFARHQVQRLGDAGGGDDLLRRGGDFEFGQLELQLLAQRQEALRTP